MNDVLLAFALTLLAGMATAIGSAVAFFAKRTSYRFLSIAAGFSAGVMLYVSFVEILVKGNQALTVAYGDWGPWVNVGAFFVGILLIALIDNLIPSAENPHEPHSRAETASLHDEAACHAAPTSAGDARAQTSVSAPAHDLRHQHLMRMGLFTALAIGIHNFPEGMATFFAALQDPAIGIAIAVAVALHNIPEGVSVSVPIFYATGSRKRAFAYSVLSGLAEPVGALLAFVAIRLLVGSGNGTLPPQVMGVLFAGVAGIMVYISLDQLLPTSRAYGKGHDSLLGIIAGMLVMALSLLILT